MKLTEKVHDVQTSLVKIDSKKGFSKGVEFMQIPKKIFLTKPTTPMTRSSSRKMSLDVQGLPVVVDKPHTSPKEGERTVKRLNK
jgi:hypothetical protein